MGGNDQQTGHLFSYVSPEARVPAHHPGLDVGLKLLAHPFAGTLIGWAFPVVTLFEVSSPLCLLSRRFRAAWLAVMLPFHGLSWLLLNVIFWQNLVLIVVLLTPVDKWFPLLRSTCLRVASARPRT